VIPFQGLLLGSALAGLVVHSLARGHESQEPASHPTYQPHKHAAQVDRARFVTSRASRVELPLPTDQEAFVFAVFGDRTGGSPEGVDVLRAAVRDTNLFEPDLVMTVGDLVQGYSDTASWLPEMRQFKEVMDQLLCPWFPVAGNHDIYWRGPNRPPGEHEADYEMHFGPLWYAFEHKNCWFIVLYSDEGDPRDGTKTFEEPRAQRMSPAQFDWLKQTLDRAQASQHVFLFLHHPRWLGGGYGDDWQKVHRALVDAGNVRAVFAGHIHRMRYDGPRDGIEYVTLATVGGAQSGVAPQAGYLHQYHLVTVRDKQIAMACVPVGNVMDVRAITGEISDDVGRLARTPPTLKTRPLIDVQSSEPARLVIELFNPTSRPIEMAVHVESPDRRWVATPDHLHRLIHPGQRITQPMGLRRISPQVDHYHAPQLVVHTEYLAPAARIALAEQRVDIPVRLRVPAPPEPPVELAARLDGNSCLAADSEALNLPEGPFTLECWFKAQRFGQRVGLVSKAQRSEYGLFASGGVPYFTVHLDGRYVQPISQETQLEIGRWYHLAGVYDGAEVRTYLDGQVIAREQAAGKRDRNGLPLMIGADVEGPLEGINHLEGWIDAVRLSKGVRYAGDSFTPQRRVAADPETLLLLNFDGFVGPWAYDESSQAVPATRIGNPVLEVAGD
jgi:hypothetical protein